MGCAGVLGLGFCAACNVFGKSSGLTYAVLETEHAYLASAVIACGKHVLAVARPSGVGSSPGIDIYRMITCIGVIVKRVEVAQAFVFCSVHALHRYGHGILSVRKIRRVQSLTSLGCVGFGKVTHQKLGFVNIRVHFHRGKIHGYGSVYVAVSGPHITAGIKCAHSTHRFGTRSEAVYIRSFRSLGAAVAVVVRVAEAFQSAQRAVGFSLHSGTHYGVRRRDIRRHKIHGKRRGRIAFTAERDTELAHVGIRIVLVHLGTHAAVVIRSASVVPCGVGSVQTVGSCSRRPLLGDRAQKHTEFVGCIFEFGSVQSKRIALGGSVFRVGGKLIAVHLRTLIKRVAVTALLRNSALGKALIYAHIKPVYVIDDDLAGTVVRVGITVVVRIYLAQIYFGVRVYRFVAKHAFFYVIHVAVLDLLGSGIQRGIVCRHIVYKHFNGIAL